MTEQEKRNRISIRESSKRTMKQMRIMKSVGHRLDEYKAKHNLSYSKAITKLLDDNHA